MVESDEEQLEVLKKWWEENGTSLVITVVLALGGTLGYQAWEDNVRQTGEEASAVYEDLTAAVSAAIPGAEEDPMKTTAMTVGETLKSEHEGTAYAVFTAMQLAKLAVDTGDLERAETELRKALDMVDDANLETLIRVRLARVSSKLAR